MFWRHDPFDPPLILAWPRTWPGLGDVEKVFTSNTRLVTPADSGERVTGLGSGSVLALGLRWLPGSGTNTETCHAMSRQRAEPRKGLGESETGKRGRT